MTDSAFRYAIEYLDDDGAPIDLVPIEPDWTPAREWVHFRGVRRGERPASAASGAARIEPVFDSTAGAPIASAFRVVFPEGEDPPATTGSNGADRDTISALPYFRSKAREGTATLVDRGVLAPGASYQYRVCAWATKPDPLCAAESSLGMTLETSDEALAIETSSLAEFHERSSSPGSPGSVGADEMPVFVPREILAEAEGRAHSAGRLESGGILVGKLHRDAELREVFLEITALIPAAHAEAERLRLTFQPETWTAVRNAMELRDANEAICGFQHSHPRFCGDCPAESRASCVWARPFFSGEDVHLHRTIFPKAFQVALLTSDLGGPTYDQSLFGWDRGVVSARGFQVID
jgi:hypothetical protein